MENPYKSPERDPEVAPLPSRLRYKKRAVLVVLVSVACVLLILLLLGELMVMVWPDAWGRPVRPGPSPVPNP
jgi:hypothetical protein